MLSVSMYCLVVFLAVSGLCGRAQATTCTSPTVPPDLCDCFVNSNNGKEISCRYKNLTQIPQFTKTNEIYEKLLFSSTEQDSGIATCAECNRITSIPAHAFANISVLLLDLLKNPITTIDPDAFYDVPFYKNLKELYIQGDGTNLPPYVPIQPFEYLEILHLRNYAQTEMTEDTSGFLNPRIRSITLENFNGLHNIDGDVFAVPTVFSNLATFHLKGMHSMTALPIPAIIQLHASLEHLYIEDTGITEILGNSFSNLNRITELKIQHNLHLTKISATAFEGLAANLTYLYLNGNNLGGGSNPGDVLGFLNQPWQKLSHLNFGYNDKIATIPANKFATLGKLDYLDIQEIGLTSIDSTTFSGLNQLHTLDISYNSITSIQSRAFSSCPTLNELRINHQQNSGAQISLSADAFQGVESSLQHLLIGHNSFDVTTLWTVIAKLTNLVELRINSLGLSQIPDYAFRSNTILETLYAESNTITTINQSTFFGPRTTLREIHLNNNKMTTVDICLLNDFSTKPHLTVTGNPLHCDCQLVWMYNWVHAQDKPEDASLTYIGPCSTPASLTNKYFYELTKADMCPGGNDPVANCPDLYATTQPPTTTTSSTTTTTTTERPIVIPNFSLIVLNKGETFISLTWNVDDETDVTGFRLEMSSNYQDKQIRSIHKDEKSYTFDKLQPQNFFTFCLYLELNEVVYESKSECQTANTLAPVVSTTTTTETPSDTGASVGIIAGVTSGAVLLIILIIIIVFVLLRANRAPKEKPPAYAVSFNAHPHANIPQAGGTAKRFAKKPDKEGASAEDIGVSFISNGQMVNKDRISAGSYQFLNEKGVNPLPSTSSGRGHPGASYGHYTNDVDDRPLPKAPNGSAYRGGATGHGYVNDPAGRRRPETSTNEYSEVNSDSPSVV